MNFPFNKYAAERVNSVLPAPLKIVGSFGKTTATGLTATISPGAQVQYTAPGGSSVTPTILAESPLKQTHVLVRCIVDFTLEVPASHSTKDVLTAWQGALCSSDTVFLVNGNTLAGNQTLRELGASWDRPVVFSAFTRPDTQAGNMAAPSASIQPCSEDVRWSTVHLDVLCYVPVTTTAGKAATDYVSPALKAQLQSVIKELAPTPGGAPRPLRALHFLPPGYTHYITLVYSLSTTCLESDEESLLPLRAALHAALGLPVDRPLLRVANAVDPGSVLSSSKQETSTAADQKKRLRNVHVGVPPSGVKGGTQHLVRGDYDYHHYMQDKFDDSGWGCAYRSLQTLCSWFTAQHYTARAPPGHREIQSTLVTLGDKTGDFVGSKQWIGAIELGYILDSLLGVTSKVITVPSGDQMPSKARELAAHFDTQGEGMIAICFDSRV